MATRAIIELLRWLGPWADPEAAPAAVVRSEAHSRASASLGAANTTPRVVRWSSARSRGAAIVLLPGLHFLGVDDPRLDRFARILAHAGAEVLAPDVRAFRRLMLEPAAIDDAAAALALAREHVDHDCIGVFSISFGSILALHLAARHRLRGLVLFGGYRHHDQALRFALGAGALDVHRGDPLNGPAVVANLAPELLPAADVAPFVAAAYDFCTRTWGRSELKSARRHVHAAWDVVAAHDLSAAARTLFLQSVGVQPGMLARAEAALVEASTRHAWLDPTPLLPHVTCPVTLIHGRDDDVIPWAHAEALARDLPDARAWITGLYGHTGQSGQAAAAALLGELRSLVGMLVDLSRLVA